VVIVPLTASWSFRAEQHGFLRRCRLATVIVPEVHTTRAIPFVFRFTVMTSGAALLEYHGWLTIRASPAETEDELEADRQVVDRVRSLIDQLGPAPGLMDFRFINGEAFLHFGGFTNHRSQDVDDVFQLVRAIVHTAPGSYGVLYVHDDEVAGRSVNAFRVFVAARGQLVEHADPFLSPVDPVIEDSGGTS